MLTNPDRVTRRKFIEPPKVRLCISYRLLVTLSCMACMLLIFASQDSMSSAIVCMVRQNHKPNGIDSQPLSNYTSMNVDIRRFDVQEMNQTKYHRTKDIKQPWLFDWSLKIQGWLLFSFFLCYFIVQAPSGLLVSRCGPKRVLVISLICAGLGHLLTIPATQLGLPFVIIARIIAGSGTGCLFTSTFGLLGMWAPRQEASLLYSIAGVGMEGGNVLSFGISMLACEVSFQGGWPLVFYLIGGFQILLAIFFILRVTNLPANNRYISAQEARYIEKNVAGKANEGKRKTPIRRILQSMCVYAIAVSQVGTLLMYYTVMTQGPIYLRDVIHLSSFQINVISSVPFLLIIPLVFGIGRLSDWIVNSGILNLTTLRKVNDGLCKCFGMTALVGLCFVPRLGVVSSFMCYFTVGLAQSMSYVSFFGNAYDLSPAYVGFVSAIQQVGSLWVSFAIPPVVGFVVQEKTRENWRLIFFTGAAVQAIAYAFYLKFGSGQLQPWAFGEEYEIVISNNESNKESKQEKSTSPFVPKNKVNYGSVIP